MPGWITNGLPTISAPVQNGVTVAVGQISQNGTLYGGEGIAYTQLGSTALIPADTESTSGAPPQTVAATAWQIAAHASGLIDNTGSSTAGAATLNTVSGKVQTESLSTAVGASYTFTLTNSLITATSPIPQVELLDYTNTAGAASINSITNGSGSTVVVFSNTGTAAWNGKKSFLFHI